MAPAFLCILFFTQLLAFRAIIKLPPIGMCAMPCTGKANVQHTSPLHLKDFLFAGLHLLRNISGNLNICPAGLFTLFIKLQRILSW